MPDPGPPRFTTVGDSLLLSVRRPDETAAYRWSVVDAPADSAVPGCGGTECSDATLADGPVAAFEPDVSVCFASGLRDRTGRRT